ncbi:hypothetical protein P3X46_027184 [Hevea brasiliensis]|uniref:Uncharacterized protein n=1 Tax=Hevea brasiliensis TaxID=3981 RepID=A0ABQ9L051_HEVBR|nr:uncharacterized protein LOC110666839 [Hevea brasiliensis]KAJ9153781.1 hypothetical protein P3X46_027184 [Hevea brasiliensis]
MKITGKSHSTATFPGNYITSKAQNPQPHPDLKTSLKPRRRTRNPSLTRSKRTGTPLGRRSRPETPFLKWKIEDRERNVRVEEHEDELEEKLETCARKGRRKITRAVSARKLAAGLWRLQLPETMAAGTGERRRRDQLGFQPGGGHVGISFLPHHSGKANGSEVQDPSQRPSSVSGMKKIFLCKLEPSLQFSNSAMEGATKWDPVCLETLDEVRQSYGHLKRLDQQVSAVSVVSALEAELEHARTHIQELEAERRSSKKKLEHFLKKVSEERAAWRSREHEKIRVFIDDIKTDLNHERKNRQRLEIVNSKLVNELAEAKVSAKRFMLDYEKERKARELVEEVCDELAKEIGEDKAEVEALKRESLKLQEEVNEERKMLQMAEVWREERVQMKLVDAKVLLEEKYSQMNRLVADLENFLRSRSAAPDLKEMREVESLVHAAASVNIQDIKDFTYEPPNPDDIFSVFEEFNSGDPNEREIEQCVAYSPASHAAKIHTVSPEVNLINKDGSHRHSDAFVDQNGDIEEDESGWETVSHLEDQGSSYSPEGSIPSVNRNRRDSNVSASGTDWEENAFDETPLTEISELCSVPTRQLKKVSSIAKLWRSCPNNGDNYNIISVDGMNGRTSNGRKSNGGIVSPDIVSGKGGLSPDLVGQWSSPDSGNPHISRGMKGCIEWPRGTHKSSLKAKLMEARRESQKVQLRHVLKQKI